MEEKTILKVENISKSFGGIHACSGVSFHVNEGEVVSIIGPNGAGKTTVFNLLTGVYKMDNGVVHYKENNISNLKPQKIVEHGIARTFQNIRLFKDMRVLENILVGTHIQTEYNFLESIFRTKKFKEEENHNIARSLMVLKMLQLYDKRNQYASDLPYGDQRKVEIARAIATGADLILLDEPAAGMNPNEAAELLRFIKELKGMGITILMIEHDMSVVMNVSDRVYVLDDGVQIAEGVPEEVANNEDVIRAYLGGELDA